MDRSLSQISLDLINVFHQVAKLGSMTSASKVLFVTQPAVSHSIALLEDQLGFALFERTGRRLILTDEGRTLFQTTQNMFCALRQADRELKEMLLSKKEILRIGCPFLLLQTRLTPVLALFHKAHPEVRIRVEIENRMQPMLDLLREDKVDLLFLATPEQGRIETDFVEQTLGTYRYGFLASKDHFSFLQGKKLSLQDVNAHPIVILQIGNNTRDYLDRRFSEAGLTLNVQWETETMAVTEEFTKAGFGLGAMLLDDRPVVKHCNEGLFELTLKDALPTGRYLVLHHSQKVLPETAKQFLLMVHESAGTEDCFRDRGKRSLSECRHTTRRHRVST